MRGRKLIAIAAAFAAAAASLAGLLAITARPSRCPVDLKLMSMAPSGTVGDDGRELWLVTLSISNCSAGALTFTQDWMSVEAKVAGRWVQANNLSYLRDLLRHGKTEALVLLPPGTDACRLGIKYVPEPLHLRLMWIPAKLGLWRQPWYRGLARRVFPVGWFEPLRSDYVGRSPHWRLMHPEVAFPRRSPSPAGTFDQTHDIRPVVDAGAALQFAIRQHWPGTTEAGCSAWTTRRL
jgi:hypothetical protein